MEKPYITKMSIKNVKYIVAYYHNATFQVYTELYNNKKDLLDFVKELDENAISYEVNEIVKDK